MQIFTILLLTVLASRHRERKELAKILEKQFKKYDGIKCEIKKKKHHRKCERECVSQQNNGCCSPCSPCCQGLGCSNCCNKTQTCECRKCRKCPTTGQTNCCSPCCKPCSPCCQGAGCSNCCNKTQTCECRKCRKCPTTGQTNCCSPCCKPCSPCCQGAGCSNCCNKTQTCEQRRCGRCPELAQNGCGSSSCSPCCQGGGCSNCCNKTQTCKCRKCRKCPTTGQNNCCSPCCKPCSPCCQGAGCSNCCNKTQVCEKKKKHCKKSKKHCHRRRCECQPQAQQGCSPCSPCSPCCQQGMAPALMAPLFAPAPAAAPFMANPAPFVNAAQFSSTAAGTEAPLAGQQSAPLQEGSYGEETITRTASGQERITCNPARTLATQPCSSLSKISPCLTSICQKGVQALSLTQQNLLGNPLRNIASFFPCLQQYPCIQQLLARTANTPFSLPLFQGCLDELNKIIDSKEAVQTLPKQPSKLDKIIHEVSLGNVVMKELFEYIKNAVPIKSTDPTVPQPIDPTIPQPIDPAVPQPIDPAVPQPIDPTDSIQPTTNDINFDKIIDKLDALEKKLDSIDLSVLDSLLKFQSTTEEKLKTMEEIQEKEYLENQKRSDKMNKLLQDISDQVQENTQSLEKNRADINRSGTLLSNFEAKIDLLNQEVSELKDKIDKTKDEIENLKKVTEVGVGH